MEERNEGYEIVVQKSSSRLYKCKSDTKIRIFDSFAGLIVSSGA